MGETGPPGCGTAAFVRTAADVHTVIERRAGQPEKACAIGLTSTLSPWLAAEQASLDFRPHSDWIGPAEYSAAMWEAVDLSRTWFAEAVGEPGDPLLLESIRLEMLQVLSELVLSQRVAGRALDELAPARAVLMSGQEAAGARVAGAVAWEAEARGIEVEWVAGAPGEASPGPRSGSRRGRAAGRAALIVQQAARNAAVLAGLVARQALAGRTLVVGFGAGVDSINQERLLPSLARAGAFRTALVRAGSVDPTMLNRPPAAGGDRAPVLCFLALNSMLGWKRHLPPCRRWWDLAQARQSGSRGRHAALLANPYLRPWLEQVFLHLLPHALATRRDVARLLAILRPRLVLTSNETSFPVRTLVLEAKKRRIATLGLMHSGLNNMLYRDFESDRLAGWGEVHVRDAERVLCKEPSRLVAIGNPQYDTLPLVQTSRAAPEGAGVPRAVVVTATSHWHMAYFDLRQHRRVWHELVRLPSHGVHVTIKPHPRFDDYGFYRTLGTLADWRDGRPGIALAEGEFAEEVLPHCDVVVVPSLPTTAAVEAMLFGKPVVYLRCGFEELDFCTSIAPGCEVVTEVERIVPAVLEVLRDPRRRASVVGKGQAFLDRFLGARDGGATGRLSALVAGLAGVREPPQ